MHGVSLSIQTTCCCRSPDAPPAAAAPCHWLVYSVNVPNAVRQLSHAAAAVKPQTHSSIGDSRLQTVAEQISVLTFRASATRPEQPSHTMPDTLISTSISPADSERSCETGLSAQRQHYAEATADNKSSGSSSLHRHDCIKCTARLSCVALMLRCTETHCLRGRQHRRHSTRPTSCGC